MTYYKGLIIDNRLLKQYDNYEVIGCKYPNEINASIECLNISSENEENLKKLINQKIFIYDSYSDLLIEDKELIKYFDTYLKEENKKIVKQINNSSNNGTTIPIVYELVKDKDGNLFGRELYTKELFPIYNSKCEKFNYYISSREISLKKIEGVFKCYIKSVPAINVSSMLKCGNFIVKHQVANLNDYNTYMNKFKENKLFKKINELKEIERYKEKIIKYSNENVFKEDFCLEEDNKKDEIIKDVVLQKISETNKKIDKSILDNNKKEELKKSLIELAHYYVETIKNMNNNKSVNLNVNEISIISLRQDIMKKLVEIEMQLPPEDINNLMNELNILEKEIIKRM